MADASGADDRAGARPGEARRGDSDGGGSRRRGRRGRGRPGALGARGNPRARRGIPGSLRARHDGAIGGGGGGRRLRSRENGVRHLVEDRRDPRDESPLRRPVREGVEGARRSRGGPALRRRHGARLGSRDRSGEASRPRRDSGGPAHAVRFRRALAVRPGPGGSGRAQDPGRARSRRPHGRGVSRSGHRESRPPARGRARGGGGRRARQADALGGAGGSRVRPLAGGPRGFRDGPRRQGDRSGRGRAARCSRRVWLGPRLRALRAGRRSGCGSGSAAGDARGARASPARVRPARRARSRRRDLSLAVRVRRRRAAARRQSLRRVGPGRRAKSREPDTRRRFPRARRGSRLGGRRFRAIAGLDPAWRLLRDLRVPAGDPGRRRGDRGLAAGGARLEARGDDGGFRPASAVRRRTGPEGRPAPRRVSAADRGRRGGPADPGAPLGFGTVFAAQADAELEGLVARGRRAVRVRLGADPASGIAGLTAAVARESAA